ncbi:hypothetical protein Aduo_009038 [Ancylostoma duodenale]
MIRMTNLLNVKSWDCFVHKLQLAAKKGLQLISAVDDGADSLIGPVFKIVRKMKKGIEVHWDSIYDMLTRILEVRRVLELFLLDHRNYPQLDAEDWELIKKIV